MSAGSRSVRIFQGYGIFFSIYELLLYPTQTYLFPSDGILAFMQIPSRREGLGFTLYPCKWPQTAPQEVVFLCVTPAGFLAPWD
jgi:hypothetical protein